MIASTCSVVSDTCTARSNRTCRSAQRWRSSGEIDWFFQGRPCPTSSAHQPSTPNCEARGSSQSFANEVGPFYR